MSAQRDGFGRMKRTERKNRDWRRAHFTGARRRVEAGNALPEHFGNRMRNALLRWFA